ncbi:MAG: ribonuclease HI [Candidatus Nitrospinota bacterium M3_3B_026]
MSGKPKIEIFCDGACRGNPGPGGWGAILRGGGREKRIRGYKAMTTNNEMELTAAIEALKALKTPSSVTVTSDSNYVVKGMTEWIHDWRRRGWKTAARKPVKNRELWEKLAEAASRHEVRWAWIRGHNGHPENELADRLANEAIDRRS